jgi:kanamycin kinase
VPAPPSPRIPPVVLALLDERGGAGEATVVWAFAPGRVTWRLRRPEGEPWYLKVAPAGEAPSLADEAARMRWLGPRLAVPRVLGCGEDGGQEWLLTAAVAGTSAVDPALRADPGRLVPLLAEGLRRFHGLPWGECPFDARVDPALATVRERLSDGRGDPGYALQRHGGRTAAEALRFLEAERPPAEDLVVCHGDYCVPNVLIRDWRVAGFVDLGAVGVADRWRDLSVALWSVTRNMGPGWEDRFLQAYGVRRDPQRLAYYALLYDLLP